MNDLEIWGFPARVVVELDIGDGRRVSVPVTDEATLHGAIAGPYAELRIGMRHIGPLVARAVDKVQYHGLDR